YLNLYGIYHLGDKFDKKYEWKSILKKLRQLCKDVAKKDYPINDDLYKDIKLLFDKRDSLVHHKAHSINLKTSSIDEFDDFINKNLHYAFSDIEKSIGLYDRLKTKLKELEGIEFDVIEQQNKEAKKEFHKAVMSMFIPKT
ncbi:MAG: hypothetical protein PHO15_09840, partial [Eubacteriales bacterium]|nr:hypothetical protein [Eubacteriales bacterium]